MRRALLVLATAALLAAACGGDDGDGGEATDDGAGRTTTTAGDGGDEGGCPDETMLEIVNGASATGLDGPVDLADRPIDVVTGFEDGTQGNATLVFADYEFEEDPQFGLSAPVGDPQAPDGGLYLSISITSAGDGPITPGDYPALEPGEGAVSSPADLTDPDADIPDLDPHVNFQIAYLGAERIVPLGSQSVMITEATETQLCGEILGDTDESELQVQGFPVFTGRFVVDRV